MGPRILHKLYHPYLSWVRNSSRSWLASTFSPGLKISKTNQEKKFVFIVGSGRSGNTLLRRLMMEQLDIFIPPETYVLPKIANYRIRARGLKWPALVDLVISAFEYHSEFETFNVADLREYAIKAKSWNKENQTLTNLLIEFYRWWAEQFQMPRTWLGDKTPWNTLHLMPIAKIIPKAKYVYLLRDGADVSVSYVYNGIYKTYPEAARRWVRSHQAWCCFKKSLHEDQYMEIRYEDFVAKTENILEQIGNKFCIPQYSQSKVTENLGDVPTRAHHANVFQPITTDTIGKGRDNLSESQKKQLRPIINSLLSQVGYDPL